jgi:hypothetical protein
MNTKLEKRILCSMLECINATTFVARKYRLIGYSLMFGPIVASAIVFNAFDIKDEQARSFGMFFSGFLVGFSLLFISSSRQVPIVAKYMNKNEIKNRLDEIEHISS